MSLHGGMLYIDDPSHVYMNESQLWKFTIYGMCGSRKYSNLQPRMVIWFAHPFPPEFFSLALYFSSKFGYWDPPPTPSYDHPWWGYGYVLDPHNVLQHEDVPPHWCGFLKLHCLSTEYSCFSHFSSKSKFKNGFGIHDKDSPRHGCLEKIFIDYR